jgi:hypothetical protein
MPDQSGKLSPVCHLIDILLPLSYNDQSVLGGMDLCLAAD